MILCPTWPEIEAKCVLLFISFTGPHHHHHHAWNTRTPLTIPARNRSAILITIIHLTGIFWPPPTTTYLFGRIWPGKKKETPTPISNIYHAIPAHYNNARNKIPSESYVCQCWPKPPPGSEIISNKHSHVAPRGPPDNSRRRNRTFLHRNTIPIVPPRPEILLTEVFVIPRRKWSRDVGIYPPPHPLIRGHRPRSGCLAGGPWMNILSIIVHYRLLGQFFSSCYGSRLGWRDPFGSKKNYSLRDKVKFE